MRKYIIPAICYLLIVVILLNANKITDFLAVTISSNQILTIDPGNAYTKDYDFIYIQNSKDYIPYSYNDLLNILYGIINQGWQEFTFYCPSEYTECINDISNITKDELILTHINNYVHPYNSFDSMKASIAPSGEITVTVKYLYTEEKIKVINEYVDKVINDLYKKDDNDYDNLKRIHDYIVNNTKYDVERNDKKTSPYESFSAYGVVKDGYGTCNGYADLMAIILSKLNFKNFKVATTDEEISYESNGHVWNAVYYDNKWVHLDLTWDDPVSSTGEDFLHHKYFLVTTEEMKQADSGNINVEEHNFSTSFYPEFS